MPTILLISNDDLFRNSLRQSIGQKGTAVLGVPNTRDIFSQAGARQVSGYDLIVAECSPQIMTDSRGWCCFAISSQYPFIAVTREDQGAGLAYGGAAARALHAWLVPVAADSMAQLTDTTTRALKGESPPR